MKILDLDAELKKGPSAPQGKKKRPKAPDEKVSPKAPPSRTPFLLGGLALVLVAGAVAWILFRNWPEKIRIGLDQVKAAVDEEFPTTGQYQSLLEATLSKPRVGWIAGSDRLRIIFDLTLAPTENKPKWGKGEQAGNVNLSTQIDVTAGIRYAPGTRGVYLEDPLIERMDVSGTPPEFQEHAVQFIGEVIESALEARPVYTLRGTDVRRPPERLRLKSYAVEDGEIVIVLGL